MALKPLIAPLLIKPDVVLNPGDLVEISRLLSSNIDSREGLLAACQKVATVNVEQQDITFEPALLTRLKSRCPSNVEFGPWLRERIVEMCHGYVGW